MTTPTTPAAPPPPDRARHGAQDGGLRDATSALVAAIKGAMVWRVQGGGPQVKVGTHRWNEIERLARKCDAAIALAAPSPAGRAHDDLEVSHGR